MTSLTSTTPMSRVRTRTIHWTSGCNFAGLGSELVWAQALGYVDGLGRVRATLETAQETYSYMMWAVSAA